MNFSSSDLLSSTFDVELPKAPYPGLRPFNISEWPIFFGREKMTHEVIDLLIDNHLVVVHGDSGCGKSSLIRAGVLAQLAQEHARSGVRWRTSTMLPRDAPLWRLALALAELTDRGNDADYVRTIRRQLNLGTHAPAALSTILKRDSDDQLCLLIDQFEELFAFAKRQGHSEASLLVDILVSLHRDPQCCLHVIVTMRSEFLGVCARYPGLAETVNATQYLLSSMEHQAMLRAIREPAPLFCGEVKRRLAERLMDDAGVSQDQLPLIQHGLMLLWRRKARVGDMPQHLVDTSAPSGDKRGNEWSLDLPDYQDAGGLEALLSTHADEVMAAAAPDPQQQAVVEHIFRALTDINVEGHAVRRPQTLSQLQAVTGTDRSTLFKIINAFRKDGVSFLNPYGTDPLDPNDQIDISHEALIRCWRKIADDDRGWLQREFKDGLTWKTLLVSAQRDEPLLPAATDDREDWLKTLPSPTWSERYDGGWNDVDALMERSRQARDAAMRKDRNVKIGLFSAALLFLLLAIVAGFSLYEARTAVARATDAAKAEAEAAKLAEKEARKASIAEKQANQAVQREISAANTARKEAERAKEAEQRALHDNSLYLAEKARQLIKEDQPIIGISYALLGLPNNVSDPERPWLSETAGALIEALSDAKELTILKDFGGRISATMFLPDGKRVVTSSKDNIIRITDIHKGHKLLSLTGHSDEVYALDVLPDGSRIISGSEDRTLRIWDVTSGDELLALEGHGGAIYSLAALSDGSRIVSGSGDKTLRIWDITSGEELQVLKGHEGPVQSLAVSSDGTRIISGSEDRTLRIWDATSGAEILVLKGHDGPVQSLAISSDGTRIVSGSDDKTLRIWDTTSGEELQVLKGHDEAVYSLVVSSDGTRIISGSDDKTLRIWDAASGEELQVLEGHTGAVGTLALSADGHYLASGSGDGTLRIWNATQEKNLQVMNGHADRVYSVAFSADGMRLVSGSTDNTVRIWNASSGQELKVLEGHSEWVRSAIFSTKGDRVFSCSDDTTIRVWDAASGQELNVLEGHKRPVLTLALSKSGTRIASGSKDEMIRVWDTATGNELQVLKGHDGDVYSVTFSSDGRRVVSGSTDKTVRIWDIGTGGVLQVLEGHHSDVYSVALSNDGRRVVSGSADKTVRIWDIDTGDVLQVLEGHDDDVYSVTFSNDGQRVVSGSADKTVRIWDAGTGEELQVLEGHDGDVYSVTFSNDGRRVVSGSADKTIRSAWIGANQQELIEYARKYLLQ